jgi:hypothetical protein
MDSKAENGQQRTLMYAPQPLLKFIMEVKVILRLLIATFTVIHSQTAVACSMQAAEAWEDTPSRVGKNFDAAEFVVVATVVDVTMLEKAAAAFPDFMMNVEHARFRVDEVFKGKPNPGDIFEIDSGFSSCARGVTHPDRLYVWDRGKTRKIGYPKQWLIYYISYPPLEGPEFEITSSPYSRPVGQAMYDLTVLRNLKGVNRKSDTSKGR